MIPLRDDVRASTFPVVTVGLIGINAAAFVMELGMGPRIDAFFKQAAVITAVYSGRDRQLDVGEVLGTTFDGDLGLRVLVSMFLHGGWAHFLGNMLYLWIFGDNVEDRMGRLRFLVFYLLCGWVAAYAHIAADAASPLPAIGASGAIAGVLGAYLTLYPHARVVTFLPLGLFSQLVQIPALFFLGFWFLQQFLSGAMSLTERTNVEGGVAWWAHIGGFAAGFVLVWLFAKREKKAPPRDAWWKDRYAGRRLRGY